MFTNGLKNEVAPLLSPISKTPWRSPGFMASIVALTVPDWVLPPTWYDTTMPASSAASQKTSQGFRFIWRVFADAACDEVGVAVQRVSGGQCDHTLFSTDESMA